MDETMLRAASAVIGTMLFGLLLRGLSSAFASSRNPWLQRLGRPIGPGWWHGRNPPQRMD